MSTYESMPSWVSREVAMLVQEQPQLMDQIRAISRRRAMRTFMPVAQDLEPEFVKLSQISPAQTDDGLDWAA